MATEHRSPVASQIVELADIYLHGQPQAVAALNHHLDLPNNSDMKDLVMLLVTWTGLYNVITNNPRKTVELQVVLVAGLFGAYKATNSQILDLQGHKPIPWKVLATLRGVARERFPECFPE